MKAALFGRHISSTDKEYLAQLIHSLRKSKIDFAIEEKFYDKLLGRKKIESGLSVFSETDFGKQFDYLLSLGGDGTMLDAVALVKGTKVPILGINFGRLGFLASTGKEEIAKAIEGLKKREFVIEKRSLIKVEGGGSLFASNPYGLNEFSIQRKNSSSMVQIATFINGQPLHTYWGDGIIVATPTGSTAYSMSCGGPVVYPGAENFILTPIAPHNLNVRPLVFPDDVEIRFEVSGRSRRFLSTLDTRLDDLEAEQSVTVKRAGFSVHLISLNQNAFIDALKSKLFWGADLRS